MKKFLDVTSKVVPFDRSNVDTDLIIPKQFLKSIKRTGFGPNLFDELRYLDEGQPDMDNSKRPLNPDFVLNDSQYRGAEILLTRRNFGCGSSREHAPWALEDYGFKVIIAPSFADIFYNNSFKNGLLLITLDEEKIDQLFAKCFDGGLELSVHLEDQVVKVLGSEQVIPFDVDAFKKMCLLEGLDDIGMTLQHREKIEDFQAEHFKRFPWLNKKMTPSSGVQNDK